MKQTGLGVFLKGLLVLELAMGIIPTSMNDSLRSAVVVEVEDLL